MVYLNHKMQEHGQQNKMKILNLKLTLLKFTTNTTGTVHLVNDVMLTKTLKQNPIETNSTAGSGTTFGSSPNHKD